jgi:hypothetical protein
MSGLDAPVYQVRPRDTLKTPSLGSKGPPPNLQSMDSSEVSAIMLSNLSIHDAACVIPATSTAAPNHIDQLAITQ